MGINQMKRFLRAVLAFLDRKFPDRVEITLQEYNELHQELGMLNVAVQQLPKLDIALKALSDDLQLVKSNLGYTQSKKSFIGLER